MTTRASITCFRLSILLVEYSYYFSFQCCARDNPGAFFSQPRSLHLRSRTCTAETSPNHGEPPVFLPSKLSERERRFRAVSSRTNGHRDIRVSREFEARRPNSTFLSYVYARRDEIEISLLEDFTHFSLPSPPPPSLPLALVPALPPLLLPHLPFAIVTNISRKYFYI